MSSADQQDKEGRSGEREVTGRGARQSQARASGHNMRHSIVGLVLVSVAFGMLGLAYAAVPLYKIFCQVTGYGGTTQRAAMAPKEASKRMVTVRFDANVSHDLDWRFQPVQRSVRVHIGEEKLIFYKAENLGDHPVTGSASFNVSPSAAGKYFKKIQCFCFTEQTLDPGERRDMSVSFFIDPGFQSDRETQNVHEITLSYTFFEKKKKNNRTAAHELTAKNGHRL